MAQHEIWYYPITDFTDSSKILFGAAYDLKNADMIKQQQFIDIVYDKLAKTFGEFSPVMSDLQTITYISDNNELDLATDLATDDTHANLTLYETIDEFVAAINPLVDMRKS